MKTGKFEKYWWILMFLITSSLVGVSVKALLDSNLFGLVGLIGATASSAMLYQNKNFLLDGGKSK